MDETINTYLGIVLCVVSTVGAVLVMAITYTTVRDLMNGD